MKTLLILSIICLPLKNMQVTSAYGPRIHPITGKYDCHKGVDLRANHDTVYAVINGRLEAAYNQYIGLEIRLKKDSLTIIYGHLSQLLVEPNTIVQAGDPIAITGATGLVTGEHLHFAVYWRSSYINPLQFLYQMLIQNHHEQKFQTTVHPGRRTARDTT
jgi:murein DD-endopeptidase MepM/ murein hydrolase activator NlpD